MKALDRHFVEFYAASPRLAHAYRSAAKRNKGLTRGAEFRELSHVDMNHQAHESEMVVLSHADDDHLVLTGAQAQPVVTKAFHLLFTGPTTHPDLVAQWMRTTKIRSENRLHVVKVDDLEAPQVSHLLGRVCLALGRDGSSGSPSNIIDAYLVRDTLVVRGPKHRMLHVPVRSVPALKGGQPGAVRKFEIDSDGSFIYWPELDVHLGWDQFLQALDPGELRKAQQRSAGFNERYGAAIRKVRETAGILQSTVEGLTERQLRRIEQGECRATTAALTTLAKAHGLGANIYLERVATAMQGIDRSAPVPARNSS